VPDLLDHDSAAFHVEQDTVIAGPKAVAKLRSTQLLDVAVQPEREPFDLAENRQG
jgi:hypothetical protein